jgi:glycosyltransferase involved in cell wall biosynthesis
MQKENAPTIFVCSFKNEENAAPIFIADLISKLESEKIIYTLVLVDDGSGDRTTDTLEQFVCEKVHLLTLQQNIGKIAAHAVGARKFFDRNSNLIFFDGDGQHNPLEILRVMKNGITASRITVGQRSRQYRRRISNRIGTLLLKIIFRFLGIKTNLQNSELVFIPTSHVSTLLANSNFGYLPVNLLLPSAECDQIPIRIFPRINPTSNIYVTRHSNTELVRKALIQIYSEPLKMLNRIVMIGLLPIIGIFLYGVFVGLTSLLNSDPSGVGSIIVIMSFSSVTLMLLGLISFGFLIVTNEWSRNRHAIESELK